VLLWLQPVGVCEEGNLRPRECKEKKHQPNLIGGRRQSQYAYLRQRALSVTSFVHISRQYEKLRKDVTIT
jgi:hypothetical protein